LFHKNFVPEVWSFVKDRGLYQKAVLLLLDSAASHPRESVLTSSNGLFSVRVLLFSFTAVVQLMDQGVIASMKQCYRSLADEGGIIIAFKEKECWMLYMLYLSHGLA
jgi:hypothetical protein